MTTLTSTDPRKVVIFITGERAFIRLADGWLDLGPAEEVARLSPVDQLLLIRDRCQKAVWHQVPRRLN